MVTIADLTKRLGLEESDQSAVASWTGQPWGTEWSEEEADELVRIWVADGQRIGEQGQG